MLFQAARYADLSMSQGVPPSLHFPPSLAYTETEVKIIPVHMQSFLALGRPLPACGIPGFRACDFYVCSTSTKSHLIRAVHVPDPRAEMRAVRAPLKVTYSKKVCKAFHVQMQSKKQVLYGSSRATMAGSRAGEKAVL